MPLTPTTYGRSNPAALLAYQTAAQLRFALGRAGFAYNESADKRSWRAMLDLFDEVF